MTSSRVVVEAQSNETTARLASHQPIKETRKEMPRGDHITIEGTITEALGGGQYLIQHKGGSIRGQLSGKMKQNHIRVIPGDKVKVDVSPYDLSHGMITHRDKGR